MQATSPARTSSAEDLSEGRPHKRARQLSATPSGLEPSSEVAGRPGASQAQKPGPARPASSTRASSAEEGGEDEVMQPAEALAPAAAPSSVLPDAQPGPDQQPQAATLACEPPGPTQNGEGGVAVGPADPPAAPAPVSAPVEGPGAAGSAGQDIKPKKKKKNWAKEFLASLDT